jgi:uncharacterized membrane protein
VVELDAKHTLAKAKAELVLSTAIVVLFLEKKMQEDEERWDLVVEKARTWLGEVTSEDVLAEVWKVAEEIVVGA